MSALNDGGPAFPAPASPSGLTDASPGMTLRDYFAGQALVGLLASGSRGPEAAASLAMSCADAMIAAREARK